MPPPRDSCASRGILVGLAPPIDASFTIMPPPRDTCTPQGALVGLAPTTHAIIISFTLTSITVGFMTTLLAMMVSATAIDIMPNHLPTASHRCSCTSLNGLTLPSHLKAMNTPITNGFTP